MKETNNVKKMVVVGMLSGIAYLLMMLNFPLPALPPFLLIDFSEIPALLAAILFGPITGIAVEGIKNMLHYFIQGSGTGVPVGQLANFTAGVLFILPASYLFRKFGTAKGLTYGLVLGTIVMTLMMSILNYYIILPAYTFFLNAPALSGEQARQLIVTGILPFNVIKGSMITVIFIILFTKMKPWIQRQMAV
ncbi:ECF transporter S component [Bacillus alveayuensis]|jgi:riboflavin transporter|uniref:ECF transporter S component n=1 Tax=Aeribacillus alveayuensis TaxID=279215 RepID=UPI0005CD71B8|nr:ECF transporter S component [Bacillus alveayuensis]